MPERTFEWLRPIVTPKTNSININQIFFTVEDYLCWIFPYTTLCFRIVIFIVDVTIGHDFCDV